jgi:hypothetical protein
MHRTFLDTHVFADPAWWHWALTIPLLAGHVLGFPWAIEAALLLCAAMTLYYWSRLRRLQPFPVQVRLAFFGWLLIGLFPALHWMHYIALVGMSARVTVGYCLMGRILGLAWGNRTEPLTLSLLRRAFLSPPDGGLFYRRPTLGTSPPICSCSLGRRGAGVQGQGGRSSLQPS